jgi:hypothetical protein
MPWAPSSQSSRAIRAEPIIRRKIARAAVKAVSGQSAFRWM